MFHYIYKITFLCGSHKGSYYIGKRTSRSSPEKDSYRGSGIFCKRYYDKYGIINTYTKEILEVNPSKELNAEREAFWIGTLWKDDSNCMNLCRGGILGGVHQNQVDHNGSNNPFYGKHHSDASKALISKNKTGFTWQKTYKIGCYDLNDNLLKCYETRSELRNDGYNPKCIDNCLSGRSYTHKGRKFKTINI